MLPVGLASRVIFGAVPYLVAGFIICTVIYAFLGTLIEHRTKAHVPKRSWWVKRPVLEMCRVHRRLYPDSHVVAAFWVALAAAIAFLIAGAFLQSRQKKDRVPQVELSNTTNRARQGGIIEPTASSRFSFGPWPKAQRARPGARDVWRMED